MRPRLTTLVSKIDGAGGAAALAIAVVAIALWLRPAFDQASRVEALTVQHDVTTDRLARVERGAKRINAQIAATREVLVGLGGGLPPAHDLDTVLEQVLGLADRTGLTVDEFQPIDHRTTKQWQTYRFRLTARCDFPVFHQFCRAAEDQFRFVDIPACSVQRKPGQTDEPAVVTFTLSLYFRSEP